jgi:predicted MFS family arabinose efflux permease
MPMSESSSVNRPTAAMSLQVPVLRAGKVIATLFFIFFLGVGDNQLISPLLPLIAQEFQLDVGAAGQLVITSYAIAAAIAALIIGPLSDHIGRQKILFYASILFTLSLLIAATIPEGIKFLAATRILTGFAAGTLSTCSIAYVGDYFPYERRGAAMSIVQSGYFAAIIIAVPIGTLLASWYGWRSGFIAISACSLLTIPLIWRILPSDQFAKDITNSSGHLDKFKMVIKNHEGRASIATAFLVSAGFVGFIYYLSPWLIQEFKMPATDIGKVFIAIGLASFIGAIASGPLSDKIGKREISIAATLLLVPMFLLIPLLGWSKVLFIVLIITTIVYAFRQGPLQALATELVPRHIRGTMTAIRITASQIGIALSTMVSGYLYDHFGYYSIGIFSATLTLLSTFCIYFMKEPEKLKLSANSD